MSVGSDRILVIIIMSRMMPLMKRICTLSGYALRRLPESPLPHVAMCRSLRRSRAGAQSNSNMLRGPHKIVVPHTEDVEKQHCLSRTAVVIMSLASGSDKLLEMGGSLN